MELCKILMGLVLQNGLSPLHMASQEGHLDVVKTLIEAGANIHQADKVRTQTYLHMYDIKACDQYVFV